MGGIAIISRAVTASGDAGSGVIPVHSPLGVGVGGIFVAVALVFTLAYLDVVSASELDASTRDDIRSMLTAVVFPLLVTFVGIVLYESIRVL